MKLLKLWNLLDLKSGAKSSKNESVLYNVNYSENDITD